MNLRQMLERDEGRRYVAYPDPLTGGAPWTIGVGHTGPEVHQGLIWTDAQVNEALEGDIAKAMAGCLAQFNPWFQLLSEQRQSVILSMCFQLGLSGLLKFAKMLAAIMDGHFDHAAEEGRDSLWYRQTPQRAQRLMVQLATDQWA